MTDVPALLAQMAEAAKAGATDAELRELADRFWSGVLWEAAQDGATRPADPETSETREDGTG